MPEEVTTPDIPTARSRSGVRREVHPVDGPEWGECTRCEIEFDDLDELDQHMAEEHPVTCSMGCAGIAAYRTAAGSRYSGSAYCARHMAQVADSPPYYVYTWVLEPANDEAPRLPEDHPLEAACRGLYGSREEAQRAKYGGDDGR